MASSGDSRPYEVKRLCKSISKACRDSLITENQAKTLVGQAKHGDIDAVMRGLQTIMNRWETYATDAGA